MYTGNNCAQPSKFYSFPHNDRWCLSMRQKNKECPNTGCEFTPFYSEKKIYKNHIYYFK